MEQYESVWDAIELDPTQSADMKERSALVVELRQIIDSEGLSSANAAELFRVPPADISALLKGNINALTVELLNQMKASARIEKSC